MINLVQQQTFQRSVHKLSNEASQPLYVLVHNILVYFVISNNV